MKRSNSVTVNGSEVKVADSLFILFLRFVVESKKGKGGWVNTHTLGSERIITDVSTYQIYGRLRSQTIMKPPRPGRLFYLRPAGARVINAATRRPR